MYLSKSQVTGGISVRASFGAATLVLAMPTLALGIYWGPVYDFIARSMVMAK
jgi:NADH-quinone oxidoreductase subunit N